MVRDRRIVRLLIVHLVAGPLCAAVVGWSPRIPFELAALPVVLFFAVILCQACLLGFWAGLWEASLAMRIGGLFLGSVFLGGLTWCLRRQGPDMTLSIVPGLTASMMAILLVVVRGRWARLGRAQIWPALPTSEQRLQFSIRGIMLFTVAVALVAAGARSLRGAFRTPQDPFTPLAWGTCFVSVSLAAMVASLGRDRPTARCLAVLALSALVGGLFAFCTDPRIWQEYAYFVICHVLEASFFLGSLLVLRSCGYRLERIDRGPAAKSPKDDFEGWPDQVGQ